MFADVFGILVFYNFFFDFDAQKKTISVKKLYFEQEPKLFPINIRLKSNFQVIDIYR